LLSVFAEHRSDEQVPLVHAVALLRHAVPADVALRADAVQGMSLDAVADLLRQARLAGERLPGAAQIAVLTIGMTLRSRCRQMKL
jgi:hypothetical protein